MWQKEEATSTTSLDFVRESRSTFSGSKMESESSLSSSVSRSVCLPVGLFLCLCKWPQVCCRTSTETVRTLRDGEPRTATSTFTQLLSSADVQVQCCFTSTETKRTIRDGEPRTAISIFTRLPSVYLCSTAATRVGLLTAQLTLNAGPRTHSFAP